MHGGAHDLIGHAAAGAAQWGQMAKICQKLNKKKWEIEQTNCITLTNFDYEAHPFAGNKKVALENLWNHIKQTETISGRL